MASSSAPSLASYPAAPSPASYPAAPSPYSSVFSPASSVLSPLRVISMVSDVNLFPSCSIKFLKHLKCLSHKIHYPIGNCMKTHLVFKGGNAAYYVDSKCKP